MNENKQMMDQPTDPSEDPNLTMKNSQTSMNENTSETKSNPQADADPNASMRSHIGNTNPSSNLVKPPISSDVRSDELPSSQKPEADIDQSWFSREDNDELRARWTSIQIQFVDDPCSAVEQAEAIVADTIERVNQIVSDHQQSINQRWIAHDDISTEVLRTTMKDYRTLLDHILKL